MGFLNTVMDIGQAFGPIATGVIVGTSLGYVGGSGSWGLYYWRHRSFSLLSLYDEGALNTKIWSNVRTGLTIGGI